MQMHAMKPCTTADPLHDARCTMRNAVQARYCFTEAGERDWRCRRPFKAHRKVTMWSEGWVGEGGWLSYRVDLSQLKIQQAYTARLGWADRVQGRLIGV